MPRLFTSTQLARLKREFVEQPLTAEQIADGAITASKLDTDYAEVTDLDSANTAIQSLDGRVDVLETDLANLASGLAPVAISGAYADLTGTPAPRQLHVEQRTWLAGETDHTLAHAPAGGVVNILNDGVIVDAADFTVTGSVVAFLVAPGAAVVSTFHYLYEA
jgi:hypothetical protein